MQLVEQLWVDGGHIAGAVVAQQAIEPMQRLGHVAAAFKVAHLHALARVGADQ
jgi:hypothetical protein